MRQPTKSLLVEDNFDMGPSIARSDSFDVVHYDLMLDMTDYWGQTMQGLATIDFTVLQGGGTTMWWDLESLVVDSIHWNGECRDLLTNGPPSSTSTRPPP